MRYMCVSSNLKDIMNSEKSYDSLPNFTAADCEFLLFLSLRLCVTQLWLSHLLSAIPGIKMCACVFVFVMQSYSTSAQTPHTLLLHSLQT